MNPIDTPQTRCRAGLARGDITPPLGIYHRMWGAAVHDRATSVHRPLLADVLWLEPLAGGTAQGQLVVALDHCILEKAEVERMSTAICRAAGIAPVQVQVTTSHTHAAGLMLRSRASFPGGEMIGPYLDSVAERLAELASEAMRHARPAVILYGRGRCDLAAHRDAWDERSGQFVCGLDPAGPADDTVLVARIVADGGSTIAAVVNYACHPTTLAWDNTAISPDYVGAMRVTVEQHLGAPCLFLQGASGDLGPREGFVGDPAIADRNGRQLAFAALAALESLPPPGTHHVYQGPTVSGAVIGVWRHEPLEQRVLESQAYWNCRQWTLDLPYRADLPTVEEVKRQQAHWQAEEARAQEEGNLAAMRDCRAKVEQMTRWQARLGEIPPGAAFPMQITLWRLGDALWLFVPGEHYQTLQTSLRARFPGRPIVVVTLTGGWLPGYVPTAESYGKSIYQVSIALVAPGCAEALVEEIARWIESATEEARIGPAADHVLARSDTEMEPSVNDLGQPVGFPLPGWKVPPAPSREPMLGRYCRLEPLEVERHAEALFEEDAADADGRSWTYLAYGPFRDFSSYRAWLGANQLGDDPLFFAIVDLACDRPAGLASYLRISPVAGSIEVGHIHYSPRLQRSPAATEAMFLMMRWAFESGYRRYEWKCDALNAASRAAAGRLGLSFEGIFRQATVYKGRNRDTAWYAAIDSEWPALREAFLAWLAPTNFDAAGRQRTRLSDLTRPILQESSQVRITPHRHEPLLR